MLCQLSYGHHGRRLYHTGREKFHSCLRPIDKVGAIVTNSVVKISGRRYSTPEKLCSALATKFTRSRRLVLLLDYDGTLIPLPRRVGDERPSRELLKLLRAIEKMPDVTPAVVTGRTVDGIRSLLPLRKTWFVGIHGVQMCRGRGRTTFLIRTAGIRTSVRTVLHDLRGQIDPKFFLEDKTLGASVHLQGATPAEFIRIRRIFMRRAAALIRCGAFKFSSGKRVIEVKPAAAHKGLAVAALCGPRPDGKTFCIAIGDDRTDEDMFRSVRGRGIGIAVGDRARGADARLRSVSSVRKFLRRLPVLWSSRSAEAPI